MKILVINSGSSSLKYQYLNMNGEIKLSGGLIERIGAGRGSDHMQAVNDVFDRLKSSGAIDHISDIDAIGHRVVHGGEKFSEAVLIDRQILSELEEISSLAPLHNGPNLAGIKSCLRMAPGTPQVAVFDTAFHRTMPAHEYIYALPFDYYTRYGIRKYGFHGTSHKYAAQQASEYMGSKNLKIITCHLGSGASIAAIQNGKSIATSMGFTPLAGIVMGTRCGDIDPAVTGYIQDKEDMTPAEIDRVLNRESGLLGISGLSSDMRDLEKAAAQGNIRAGLAIEIFAYSIKKYIGAYTALLGGLDALVFTAGIGENSPRTREKILSGLEFLGISLDREKNSANNDIEINKISGRVKVLVVPTNEELMIARETLAIVAKRPAGVR